jgi:hypothetical protein
MTMMMSHRQEALFPLLKHMIVTSLLRYSMRRGPEGGMTRK